MTTTLPTMRNTAPSLSADEFEVGYIAEDGTRHRVPLTGAAAVRFEAMAPARRFNARKGQRHLPGRWWSATDGRHVGYESWLERDHLMWLDWVLSVTTMSVETSRNVSSAQVVCPAEPSAPAPPIRAPKPFSILATLTLLRRRTAVRAATGPATGPGSALRDPPVAVRLGAAAVALGPAQAPPRMSETPVG